MLVKDIICAIRARLWDTDKKLFPDDSLLLDLLNSALCEHQAINPESYAEYKIVPLVKGAIQRTDCCSSILSVDSIVSEDGSIKYKDLRKGSMSASTLFNGRCKGSKNSLPTSYSMVNTSSNTFTLEPPIKEDGILWARILCSSPLGASSLDAEIDLGCNYEDIVNYALGRALLTIPGSLEDRERGSFYLDLFYKSAKLKREVAINNTTKIANA